MLRWWLPSRSVEEDEYNWQPNSVVLDVVGWRAAEDVVRERDRACRISRTKARTAIVNSSGTRWPRLVIRVTNRKHERRSQAMAVVSRSRFTHLHFYSHSFPFAASSFALLVADTAKAR